MTMTLLGKTMGLVAVKGGLFAAGAYETASATTSSKEAPEAFAYAVLEVGVAT
jgi:hypothetical protein